MGQSPSWEANSSSLVKSPAFYGTRRFITMFAEAYHYLSQMKPVRTLHSYLFRFDIILPSKPRSCKWRLYTGLYRGNRVCSDNFFVQFFSNILSGFVVHGFETWSLILRHEDTLRGFENTMPKRIFIPQKEAVTGEWRKSHHEKLRNFCSSPNMIRMITSRRMIWAGHVASMMQMRIRTTFCLGNF
jgi:hypothetical protein